jgi:hypothetical protein
MRFVLFKGQSQYGSLRLHADQLAAALAGLGHEAGIVDLMAADAVDQLNAALASPPDCFFGFSGVGSDIKSGGQSAFDVVGSAYASLYVDHPVHHAGRLATRIDRHIALFLDRSHVQFMTAWSKGRNFRQLGFLPPGANELAEPVDLSDEAFAERDIGLLFTGTYRGQPLTPWREGPDTAARTVVESVAQRMAADARLPILDAVRAALKDSFDAELTPDLFEELLPLLQAPQYFAEAYHRNRFLETLGEVGAPLTVYGAGWEPMAARYPSFDYGGVGSFEETLSLLRRARIVLNTNNGFLAGGHERVFTAMCAGAAVFSDTNKYYADAFKEGREIVTFPWPKMAEAPGMLTAMLADEARLAGIARAGARRAMAEHRWSDRAAKLVKAVKQVA